MVASDYFKISSYVHPNERKEIKILSKAEDLKDISLNMPENPLIKIKNKDKKKLTQEELKELKEP